MKGWQRSSNLRHDIGSARSLDCVSIDLVLPVKTLRNAIPEVAVDWV